jgi:hypothetical protein
MKKIVFGLIATCAFQSTHTMEWPSQEGLNNKLIDVAAHEDLELMRKLLAAGANVNARKENKATPLWNALYCSQNPAPTCRLLLDHGADVCASPYLSETRILIRVALEDPSLLTSIVLVPNAHVLAASHKQINTILLCFKRTCPLLPRDIRLMILAKREHLEDLRWGKDEDHIVGNLMIARKLQGLPILDIFKETTIDTLYGCTMSTMINRFQIAINHDEAARPVAIMYRQIVTAPTPSLLRSRIDLNTFEATHQEALRRTVIARLEQSKLLCNNPSQAFEQQQEFIPTKTKKCLIQ